MFRSIAWLFVLLLAVSTIASCAPQAPAALPTPETGQSPGVDGTPLPVASATPETDKQVPGGLVPSKAYINAVALVEPEREGAPWTLHIEGDLADGCTRIAEVRQNWSGDALVVEIIATRPAGMVCTQALVPFTREVTLDTAGLADGTYTVQVGEYELPLTIGANATPTAPASKSAGDLLIRPAVVEDVEILDRGDPSAIRVMVSGYYPDGCTKFHGTTQAVDGARIVLAVETKRPRDAMCTMAIVPYTETVTVDVSGLAPGAYTLDVNGLTRELTLP